MDVRAFERHLEARALQLEPVLEGLLTCQALPGEVCRPERLLKAMRHAVLGGGKRLRPFLLLETARMLGVEGPGVLRAAAALEMLHCYSLVHDDLPAMDNDDLRRGRPTVHKAYDEASAILAGDGLLTLAFDVMADPLTHPDADVRARLVLGLARSSGIGGMVGGQMLDLEAEKVSKPLSLDAIMQLQAMKTGALLRYSVEAGAILGKATAAQMDALTEFGTAVGAAFQIADDLLDTHGETAKLGKAAGKDAGRNKATLVSIFGVEQSRQICGNLHKQALKSLKDVFRDYKYDVLEAAAHFTIARDR